MRKGVSATQHKDLQMHINGSRIFMIHSSLIAFYIGAQARPPRSA